MIAYNWYINYILFFIGIANGLDLFCKSKLVSNTKNEYFGYSVQLRAFDDNDARILVGAPLANSTYDELKNIKNPGAVYSCDLEGKCEQYLFNTKVGIVKDEDKAYYYKHTKDYGWLGAVLDGSNLYNETLVTCAPRWQNSYYKKYALQNGLCYVLDDARDVSKISTVLIPLRNTNFTYKNMKFNYIYGEAGMSLHYVQDSKRILVGAPGVMDWAGAITESKPDYDDKKIKITPSVDEIEDNSYLGYSVSSGKFTTENKNYYVAGAPRNKNLKGEVIVFEMDPFKKLYSIVGKQTGEYFGASLTVADITGDGFDDIIIGAPTYSGEIKGYEEVGCIYQLISDGQGNFKRTRIDITKSKLENSKFLKSQSRLGTSLASLGDINNDGYNDIAVGAPYANFGKGIVLIFFGSKSGLTNENITFLQPEPYIKGFGISISKGVDINNNGVNDFAVGAHESDHVTIFLTKFKVDVASTLETDQQSFNISTKKILVNSCLRYEKQKFVPEILKFYEEIYFNDDRFIFNENSGASISKLFFVDAGKLICNIHEIKFKDDVRHHNGSLSISMKYNLVEDNGCDVKLPYIESGSKHHILAFQNGCQDKDCIPELSLDASVKEISSSLYRLHVKVKNTGDPAFGCQLSIITKSFLKIRFNGTHCRADIKYDTFYYCTLVANPLVTNEEKHLVIDLEVDFKKVKYGENMEIANLNVTSIGTSKNKETQKKVFYTIRPKENIKYTGSSNPKYISANETHIEKISHMVMVRNKESNPIDFIELEVSIPQIFDDKKVLNISNYKVDIFPIANNKLTDSNKFCKIISNNGQNEYNSRKRKKRTISELKDELVPKSLNLSNNTNEEMFLCKIDDTNCIKIICNFTERIYQNGYLVFNITMLTDVGKLANRFGGLITNFSLESTELKATLFTIKTTFGTNLKQAHLEAYIAIGIIIGIIVVVIFGFTLYKLGCFKKKNHEYEMMQQTAKLQTAEEFEYEANSISGESDQDKP